MQGDGLCKEEGGEYFCSALRQNAGLDALAQSAALGPLPPGSEDLAF